MPFGGSRRHYWKWLAIPFSGPRSSDFTMTASPGLSILALAERQAGPSDGLTSFLQSRFQRLPLMPSCNTSNILRRFSFCRGGILHSCSSKAQRRSLLPGQYSHAASSDLHMIVPLGLLTLAKQVATFTPPEVASTKFQLYIIPSVRTLLTDLLK